MSSPQSHSIATGFQRDSDKSPRQPVLDDNDILKVTVTGGGGGGTQYVEGDTTTPATGTAILARLDDGSLDVPSMSEGKILNVQVKNELGTRILDDGATRAYEFDGSNNPIYLGTADAAGAAKSANAWRIIKITYDGSNNPTDIQYPSGSGAFTFIWNSRASYTYS